MIKVINTGFYCTLQDLGRKDYERFGVPVSGAMDQLAAKMANAILGNDENCAVLEITMVGPKLEFNFDTCISITGAELSPILNGSELRNNTLVYINKGDVLEFGKPNRGFRAYLAVSDGFQAENVLKSKSMYQGITKASCLKNDDILEIKLNSHSKKKNSLIRFNTDYLNSHVIEVFKGPEFDKLNDEQINKLLNKEFTISKDNNRMAYQLNELIPNDLNDIITSLVIPGTVQLTPSGKLIVLMRDCQTTGGYPRVLQLSEASINVLAQKFTGSKFKFKLMSQISCF